MTQVPATFFDRDAVDVAKDLIGCVLEHNGCSGRIIETEAYANDEASHGFRKTPRSTLMHDTYGHCYVYFIYGNHYCFNVTTSKDKVGAVLIRAVEPLTGIRLMQERRGKETHLADGPGKLCEAFGITMQINGTKVQETVNIHSGKNAGVVATPRIGIKKAVDLPWRFVEAGKNV